MNCEYVRKYYGVQAVIGRRVTVDGKPGIIAEDRGHYIGVNFDCEKPGVVFNCHPTSQVEYGEMGEVRKPTRLDQLRQLLARAEAAADADYAMEVKTHLALCDGGIVRRVTSSVDQVAMLADCVMPDCAWMVGKGRLTDDEPMFAANIWRSAADDGPAGEAEHNASPALAMLCALLKALIANDEAEGGTA